MSQLMMHRSCGGGTARGYSSAPQSASQASCRCHQHLMCARLQQAGPTHHRQLVTTKAGSAPAYPYNSGDDGRTQKATLEHIFVPDHGDVDVEAAASSSADRVAAPWSVGWQMNERNIMWSDDLKMRLIKRIASQELHISEEELEERLQQVFNLLPDLADRLVKADPKRVAALASNVSLIAARLLRLREIFPKANASALVGNRLSLLLDDDLDEVQAAADKLKVLLPNITVDKFVEYYPQVLDIDDFEWALQDAKRLMPKMDIAHTLRTNPEMVLSFQKGKNLIPYDPAWPVQPQK